MEDKPMSNNLNLFFGYIFFAGIATIVDVGLLYILTEFLFIWYFASAFFSYLTGMVVNYTTNKYWNFKNMNKQVFSQFSIFAGVALIGLALNQVIIYYLVEFIGLWYMFAKAIALCTVLIWSFYGHKRFSFGILK